MKIIYNGIIPFGKKFHAINLCGILFAKGPCSRKMINHEEIHTAQIRELWYLFFYVWYVVEWLIRLTQYRDFEKSYYNISFEREAYDNGDNLGYLSSRKRFAFLKYLKSKG